MKDTGIKMTLVDAKEWTGTDGRRHRREEWTISGGTIDPAWRKAQPGSLLDRYCREGREAVGGWEPSCRFSLYIVDGEVDVRLASYGGVVWPTAWPELFQAVRQGTYQATVEITDKGLMFRSAALDDASDMYADVRLS